MKTKVEIQNILDGVVVASNQISKYPSMSYEEGVYEEGVRAALEWVLDETILADEAPITKDE